MTKYSLLKELQEKLAETYSTVKTMGGESFLVSDELGLLLGPIHDALSDYATRLDVEFRDIVHSALNSEEDYVNQAELFDIRQTVEESDDWHDWERLADRLQAIKKQ
jgi:hypothetical protein